MALALPLLVPGSALTSLHTSTRSTAPAPLPCASNSIALLASCRARASGSRRVSSCRLALHRDEITSNSGSVSVCSVKSEEHCSGRSAEAVFRPVLGRVFGASALAVAASLMSGGASIADEVAASPVDGSDVGISTTVSVLFIAATVGLVGLTGGVIYLGLTEFLEKRALQEEQKKVEAANSKKEKPSKQAVKAAARSGGPKGFGSGKRMGTKGDDEEVSS